MSREIYLVRHGLSNANRMSDPAFGSPDAELTPDGKRHSVLLRPIFEHILGKSLDEEKVATSEMLRSQQTAIYAGFDPDNFEVYLNLNEYDGDIKIRVMRCIARANVFRRAHDASGAYQQEKMASDLLNPSTQALLDNPPKENVWFSHGLVIAGLTLGLDYREYRVGDYLREESHATIPYFASIRVIKI